MLIIHVKLILDADLSKDDFMKPISKNGTSPEKGNLLNDSGVVIANVNINDKSHQTKSNTDSTAL